ncbi:MAG: AAA family ATPase [Kiritimatiellae bacterium]|nr:AAA family ATPase [Kiritimatiellia bacterium]
MTIERKDIVDKLIQSESHHLVKFITGIRRCGKSFLLFNLFKNHLKQRGIDNTRPPTATTMASAISALSTSSSTPVRWKRCSSQ